MIAASKGEPVLNAMYKRLRAAKEDQSGFTLIELLIVIIILGVLAGIVVFSVSFIQSRGEAAACKTDLKNVEVAVEAYYSTKGTYPSDIDDATHTATTLVGAGVLKEAPNSTKYAITYSGVATHTVT